jgi:hypothetical protein
VRITLTAELTDPLKRNRGAETFNASAPAAASTPLARCRV